MQILQLAPHFLILISNNIFCDSLVALVFCFLTFENLPGYHMFYTEKVWKSLNGIIRVK